MVDFNARERLWRMVGSIGLAITGLGMPSFANNPGQMQLTLRSMVAEQGEYRQYTREETWDARETAVIVCDVWDYHHCLNAVRRMNEFLPQLNRVIQEARSQGATIIHAPSDCMAAYENHPARRRAVATTVPENLPADMKAWCSAIPAEEASVYPIDQSDGGEDDDPDEHKAWAEKLISLGRDPQMPWKRQSDQITIDDQKDYLSDRGEEVWAILQKHGIRNVILVGVHTNMCVLGRPFGLRQMARNGMRVVLMRDMTDTMYNPKRWPYVSHFEGTRRVIAHIEKYVCPTISSEQIIGGQEFRFSGDHIGEKHSGEQQFEPSPSQTPHREWSTLRWEDAQKAVSREQPNWLRCTAYIPEAWDVADLQIRLGSGLSGGIWVNGNELSGAANEHGELVYSIASNQIEKGDVNLIVLQSLAGPMSGIPTLVAGGESLRLDGMWQLFYGQQESNKVMPLPAKFGGEPTILHTPEEPLWQPRARTPAGEFTAGIEGPACDAEGNLYVVNYLRQGTIGRLQRGVSGELFVSLPEGSTGNGIRFAPDGTFFVADYTQHNVLRVEPSSRRVSIYAHEPSMNQPNDLAIHTDGVTLFASDPNWSDGSGQIWRIDKDGQVTRVASSMGTTNGIEVSPDGETLYVNESVQRRIWAFRITSTFTLEDKRLVKEFSDHSLDGMRCDIDGNLYVARHGKGTVVKLSPQGEVLNEIHILGTRPSNVCFGGKDRRTLYVTEVDFQRVVSMRVDRPGRE